PRFRVRVGALPAVVEVAGEDGQLRLRVGGGIETDAPDPGAGGGEASGVVGRRVRRAGKVRHAGRRREAGARGGEKIDGGVGMTAPIAAGGEYPERNDARELRGGGGGDGAAVGADEEGGGLVGVGVEAHEVGDAFAAGAEAGEVDAPRIDA